MLNSCSSMHVKSQSCIVLFDLLLQQLYGILGQPSYLIFMFYSNRNIKVKSLKSKEKNLKERLQFPVINSLLLAIFCGCAARFLSDLNGNPGERLSQDVAQIREKYKMKRAAS